MAQQATQTGNTGNTRGTTVTDDGLVIPEQCRFCGSENMSGTCDWMNVAQYSHTGKFVTIYSCEDCGGRYIESRRGNSRVTTSDDTKLESVRWDIPEGYCLSVCSECGGVAGWHEISMDNQPLFEAILSEEITTTCCDAPGELVEDGYETPKEEIYYS